MEIYPVVHIKDVGRAVREARKIFEHDADGLYLIDHSNSGYETDRLFEAYNEIKAEDTNRYVGLSLMGLSPINAVNLLAKSLGKEPGILLAPSAIWIDDMRADDIQSDENRMGAMELKNADPRLKKMRILGGVAFKYTKSYTDDPLMALYEATFLKDTVDVVTTSGPISGMPPSVEKIAEMKRVLGDQYLAVASGISAENIRNYEGIVDEVLVGRGIEVIPDSGIIDSAKLQELIEIAHSLAK